MKTESDIVEGCLIGMAVGDSMGLPMEGMKRTKIEKLGWMKHPRQRLFLGKGFVSDDTEHAMMTLEATLVSKGNPQKFEKSLRWRLRWWFIGLPAGVGMATAKSCLKLWLGIKRSGVFSAGNGPAMRSVILGAKYYNDDETRREMVKLSTILTHSDPKALIGAQTIAELAALFAKERCVPSKEYVLSVVEREGMPDEVMNSWRDHCENGVSGYMYHTVPAVIEVGQKHDWDYEKSITEIIRLGGDTDTTAAILGGLCGVMAASNTESTPIPDAWVTGIADFPRSVKSMRKLSNRESSKWSLVFPVAVIIRNILFLLIVLSHGFMRPFLGLLKNKSA